MGVLLHVQWKEEGICTARNGRCRNGCRQVSGEARADRLDAGLVPNCIEGDRNLAVRFAHSGERPRGRISPPDLKNREPPASGFPRAASFLMSLTICRSSPW